MINYIIQIILFQALFLAVYDIFLQKETFFKLNRAYLLTTPILSLIIPLLKFESIQKTVPQEFMVLLPEVVLNPQVVIEQTIRSTETFNYINLFFYVGVTFFSILFLVKLFRIIKVISSHKIIKKATYKLVLLEGKQSAFSFFNYIFINQKLTERKELQIIQHELVHSKQLHTLDLLFFEIFKIVMWFNPMLYVYQKRIAELHEYVSDAEVVKETDKHSYFNKLLSETFMVENISFVNQFYKKSFIKKRITMITKNKSQKMKQLKYLLLVPVLASMLLYSSCETNDNSSSTEEAVVKKELMTYYVYQNGELVTTLGERETYIDLYIGKEDPNFGKEISFEDLWPEEKIELEQISSEFENKHKLKLTYKLFELKNGRKLRTFKVDTNKIGVSINPEVERGFTEVDISPIFPGCEDSDNLKDCFNKSMQQFVADNFDIETSKNLGLEAGRQKIYIQFKILKTGDIEILGARAPHKDLEVEARRVINSLPKMIPGEQDGKPVNVIYMLPISFIIE
ncbi:MAG: M56 family metallopeptidase [Urechidicola sp.]|nr:M56 family metallopeptidase [Urechidicola sp.]